MAAFADANDLQETLRGFFTQLSREDDGTFAGSGVVAAFTLNNPDARLVLDGTKPKEPDSYFGVYVDDANAPAPVVELITDADTFDSIMRGEGNVMMLMMTGKMKSKGDVTRAMALMPAMTKAVPLYKEYRKK